MGRASSGSTTTFRTFTPSSQPPSAVSSGGSTAGYLQGLLVQAGERRNAENLSETVPESARGMQRFLTDSPWDDDAVIGRLQEYLAPRLGHPEGVWVVDGSEPRYYLSNAAEDTPLETLACVGGSRWRIETEFETEKGDVGLDEYETRSWSGWHHHIAMCLLGGAFLLGLQQDWGEKMPRITRPRVYRVVREMLPREWFGPEELLLWLEDTQLRNERARRSHERRRSARREGTMEPPP